MLCSTRFSTLILAALTVTISFAQALAGGLALQSGSKLWLDGKSNVHDFKSTASSLKTTFVQDESLWPNDATGGAAVEGFIRAKGVSSMEVVVGVTGLHSGKTGLDKNMYKALLAPKYPEICFRMTSYEIAKGGAPGEMAIDAKGTLSTAGVERAILMRVTTLREDETVRLRGSTPLLMSQFGIKPPKMMMGTLRTSDQVVVHFDLVLGKKDATVGVSTRE